MRILYVITDLTLGGAEVQLLRICKYVTETTSDLVFFVSLMDEDAKEMSDTIRNYGIKYYSLGMKRGKASLLAYLKFIKILLEVKPDIIHSHMIHANLLARASRPFSLGKIINTIHGEEEYSGRRKLIYKYTNFLANYTVACGKILYDQAKEYGISSEKRLRYICNGLNVNEYLFDESVRKDVRNEFDLNDSFVWMTVARLSEVKNQKYLIYEFKSVLDIYTEAKLIFVGDGPLKAKLMKQVSDLHLESNVIFLGKRDDVKRLLCAADAFVLSSVHEGLPLSMQEAGAIGLPLVSTDVGGCNEMIREGINGFLCESNREGALSKAMCKVMSCNYEKIKEMGMISRMIIRDKYDMSDVMRQWSELYE